MTSDPSLPSSSGSSDPSKGRPYTNDRTEVDECGSVRRRPRDRSSPTGDVPTSGAPHLERGRMLSLHHTVKGGLIEGSGRGVGVFRSLLDLYVMSRNLILITVLLMYTNKGSPFLYDRHLNRSLAQYVQPVLDGYVLMVVGLQVLFR